MPEMLDYAKFFVDIAAFGVALWVGRDGVAKAHADRRDALEQRKRTLQQEKDDLRWRQTVEAQAAIVRMCDARLAQTAMTMLDWNGLTFKIRPGRRERITWPEMREALRVERLIFSAKEVFVRDCFDALFNHFQLIQQQLTNKMFLLEDVLYPISYYARRIKHPANWAAFERFLITYDYLAAKSLIDDAYARSKPSGEEIFKTESQENMEAETGAYDKRFEVEEEGFGAA